MRTGIKVEIESLRRQIVCLHKNIEALEALEEVLDLFPDCCTNIYWMNIPDITKKPSCDITLQWIEKDEANPVLSLDERENIIIDILDHLGYAPFPYPYDACGTPQYRIETYNRQILCGYEVKFSIILGKEIPKAYEIKEEHTALLSTRFVFTCVKP